MAWLLNQEYTFMFDGIWDMIEPLLPIPQRDKNRTYKRAPGAGRKRFPLRIIFDTILWVLMSGAPWKSVRSGYADGRTFCSGSTAHRWHMCWSREGVYSSLWALFLRILQTKYGLQLTWVSGDGTLYKAPLALSCQDVGRNPTDRGKHGTKRMVLTDATGVPIAIWHAPANVHDSQLLADLLKNLMVTLDPDEVHHLLLDAAFLGSTCDEVARDAGFVPHVRPRGEEKSEKQRNPLYKARRWVVERTHSWMNNFRKLKVRYEKTTVSHDGLSAFAAGMITLRTMFRRGEGLTPWLKGHRQMIHENYLDVGSRIMEVAAGFSR